MKYKPSALFISLLLIYFLSGMECGFAQDNSNKKTYTSTLDSLWSSKTIITKISDNGNWIIYSESFYNRTSSYLSATDGSVFLRLKDGHDHAFSPDSGWMGYITEDNVLILHDLKKGMDQFFSNISSFEFNGSSGYLVALDETNESKSIHLIDLEKGEFFQKKNVTGFSLNPKNGTIAMTAKDGPYGQLFLYDNNIKKAPLVKLKEQLGEFKWTEWNDNGTYLATIELLDSVTNLAVFDLKGNEFLFSQKKLQEKFPGHKISDRPLALLSDGQNILFYVEQNDTLKNAGDMEIWDTSDKWIYPKWKLYNEGELEHTQMIWKPLTFDYFLVGDKETPTVKVQSNMPYALVFDRLLYEPENMPTENVDLYLKNLKNGKKELLSKKQYSDPRYNIISPTGRYVSYYKKMDWWVYDSSTKTCKNLTNNAQSIFYDKEDWKKENKRPYGSPGWSRDEKYFIVYDQYDIWLLEPNGKENFRVTKGREEKIKYRINQESERNNQELSDRHANYIGGSYDFNQTIILDMLGDDLQSGFALWRGKTNIQKLIYSQSYKNQLLISKDLKTLVYTELKVNSPPAVCAFSIPESKKKLLYQSNNELLKYDLGSYELLTYNNKEVTLKGVLIYPSQYDPEKSYPMITYIYEKNSAYVNSFSPPTDQSVIGFNLLRYVTHGYFVLLPDIHYEIGNPAFSALECVKSAVKAALNNKAIDNERIGLIGHSYGGYEASFIATQSMLFRCVVAGAPITDLVSFYHDVAWSWYDEQSWRLENQQLRMGDSFYNMKEQYYSNSPLYHVEELKTPLLLWVGKNDYNANWYQSIYMYMAMKKLKKEGKLILFNNEEHIVTDGNNQKLLSRELFNWFEHYLK